MRHLRRTFSATAAALALMLVAPATVPAQSASQDLPAIPTPEVEEFAFAAVEGELTIRPGDLVTASGRFDSLIRLRQRKNNEYKYKLTKIPMGTRMKPKGVTHNSYCEKVAVANSLNVVVYDTWDHTVEVIEHPQFGLIADVEYDMVCNLIIADMGGDASGRWPKDGKLWLLTPEGELRRIATQRNWINPAFIDMDEWGTIYVVDKAAGPRMPGTNGQWHFDAIYKIGAPHYTKPKVLYDRSGLNVTAYAVRPDGTHLVGNGDRLLVLDKNNAYTVCGGSDFRRINGVDINSSRQVFIVDGYDLFDDTFVYKMKDDLTCSLDVIGRGKMVQGAQGLAAGLPRR